MAKDVLFSSRASVWCAAVLLAGCAHSARDLPPDLSDRAPAHRLLPGDAASPEFSMSCPELRQELVLARAALSRTEARLQGTQDQNQSVGTAGILIFSPLMLAMEDNQEAVAQHRELDAKRERLLRIAQARQCPVQTAGQ